MCTDPRERFGDTVGKKGKNTLRIGFQNIGGFLVPEESTKKFYAKELQNGNLMYLGALKLTLIGEKFPMRINFFSEQKSGGNRYI